MKNTVALKLVASTLVLGLTTVGCKPSASRPAAFSAKAAAGAEQRASKLYAKAQEAVQQERFADALTAAEQAVELSPRDAGFRMLLADLYLKNGRFVSAESAFSDVLTLDPGNARASLSRVLALVAQGRTGEANMALDTLSSSAAPADIGLAYALAGQADRAAEMLEAAARAPGANSRVRQNLALAHALSGDWEKARIVAAQDLSPAELGPRLEQWAAFANPSAPHTQVASLLGVTPAEDAGQPVRLALAPVAPEVVQSYAAVEAPVAVPVAAPVAEAEPVQMAVAPVTIAEPEADAGRLPVYAEAPAAKPVDADIMLAATSPKHKPERVKGAQFAAAVRSLVEAPSPVVRASASAPVRAFDSRKPTEQWLLPNKTDGRYVVQIGAFRTAAQVETAWARAQRRYGFGKAEPLSTTVTIPGQGVFHRLAISGFDSPGEAKRLCQSIRSRQGVCFVRETAGDAPVRWASRYVDRNA